MATIIAINTPPPAADAIQVSVTAHLVGLLEKPLQQLQTAPEPTFAELAKRLLTARFQAPEDTIHVAMPPAFVAELAPTLRLIATSPLRQTHPGYNQCGNVAERLLQATRPETATATVMAPKPSR